MRKRVLLGTLLGLALVVVPVGTAAAASPAFRLTIVHTIQGCHVWLTTKALGSSARITLKPGTRLLLRSNCPMDFDLAQTAGPRLALRSTRLLRGTTMTIVFARRGVYRLTATNVQTPEDVGLQVLGAVNGLSLTVVVR